MWHVSLKVLETIYLPFCHREGPGFSYGLNWALAGRGVIVKDKAFYNMKSSELQKSGATTIGSTKFSLIRFLVLIQFLMLQIIHNHMDAIWIYIGPLSGLPLNVRGNAVGGASNISKAQFGKLLKEVYCYSKVLQCSIIHWCLCSLQKPFMFEYDSFSIRLYYNKQHNFFIDTNECNLKKSCLSFLLFGLQGTQQRWLLI